MIHATVIDEVEGRGDTLQFPDGTSDYAIWQAGIRWFAANDEPLLERINQGLLDGLPVVEIMENSDFSKFRFASVVTSRGEDRTALFQHDDQ